MNLWGQFRQYGICLSNYFRDNLYVLFDIVNFCFILSICYFFIFALYLFGFESESMYFAQGILAHSRSIWHISDSAISWKLWVFASVTEFAFQIECWPDFDSNWGRMRSDGILTRFRLLNTAEIINFIWLCL